MFHYRINFMPLHYCNEGRTQRGFFMSNSGECYPVPFLLFASSYISQADTVLVVIPEISYSRDCLGKASVEPMPQEYPPTRLRCPTSPKTLPRPDVARPTTVKPKPRPYQRAGAVGF